MRVVTALLPQLIALGFMTYQGIVMSGNLEIVTFAVSVDSEIVTFIFSFRKHVMLHLFKNHLTNFSKSSESWSTCEKVNKRATPYL